MKINKYFIEFYLMILNLARISLRIIVQNKLASQKDDLI